MQLPIAEKRTPVHLDRGPDGEFVDRYLLVDCNTMAAFQEATQSESNPEGKFYWDTFLTLSEIQSRVIGRAIVAWRSSHPGKEPQPRDILYRYGDIARELPMADLGVLVWAALHEYGQARDPDEATWPLTLNRVKRLLTPTKVLEIIPLILAAHLNNAPTEEELGEASARPRIVPKPAPAAEPPQETGGEASTELPEAAFA